MDFLPPNNLDTDKDGLTNWEEKLLGTDPNNGASIRSKETGGDYQHIRQLIEEQLTKTNPSPENAARFLMQSSLGFTPKMIKEVAQTGYETWIDSQLTKPPSLTEPYIEYLKTCLLYTSPSPRDQRGSRMPSSA